LKKQKAAKQAGSAVKKDKDDPPAGPPPPYTHEPKDGKSAAEQGQSDKGKEVGAKEEEAAEALAPIQTTAAPSLSQQSKARSASFRKPSVSGPLSPSFAAAALSPTEGETAPDIYRKHVARIEELERENKRLAKDAADAEKRWHKAEEEIADLREADGDTAGRKTGASDGLVQKLVGHPCIRLPVLAEGHREKLTSKPATF
jgi:hypothetical protein